MNMYVPGIGHRPKRVNMAFQAEPEPPTREGTAGNVYENTRELRQIYKEMVYEFSGIIGIGVVFFVAGFSDLTDEFCLTPDVEMTAKDMAGPTGVIVQWNRAMAVLFLVVPLFFLASTGVWFLLRVAYDVKQLSVRMMYCIHCILIVYRLIIFVYTCIGMDYVFARKTPLYCRETKDISQKFPYFVMWLYSVISVVFYSIAAGVAVCGVALIYLLPRN